MNCYIPINWNIVAMILTDILPVICNLYLIITRTHTRMTPGAESETPFPDLVTHHPKAVLAGG
jgi:hypothetical protein